MCHIDAEKVAAREEWPVFALLVSLFHGEEVVELSHEVEYPRPKLGRETTLKLCGAFRVLIVPRASSNQHLLRKSRRPHRHLHNNLTRFEIAHPASW